LTCSALATETRNVSPPTANVTNPPRDAAVGVLLVQAVARSIRKTEIAKTAESTFGMRRGFVRLGGDGRMNRTMRFFEHTAKTVDE
jgi:hypothetical protein